MTTPNTQPTELDKAIEEIEDWMNGKGFSSIHYELKQLILAANRFKDMEKENARLKQQCLAEASCNLTSQEELTELRTGYKQALEEVKIILNDYSSDLVVDNICRKILSTPLAIATMKGKK